MTEFGARFLDDYFAECEDHLTVVRRGLLALEGSVGRSRPDATVTEELFRSFHSLKGLAGMVEDRDAELLSHELESYLRAIREGDVRLSTNGVDVLIAGAKALEHTIAARRSQEDVPDNEAILASLRTVIGHAPALAVSDAPASAEETEVASWECVFTPSAELIARGVNVDLVRSRLRASGDIVSATPLVTDSGVAFRFLVAGNLDPALIEAWREDGIVSSQHIEPNPSALESTSLADGAHPRPMATLSSGHYVRVDLARLDELMRMIGDLVIMRSRLADTLARLESRIPPAELRIIQENATAIERQLRELREGVMRVRLVPVGEIFRRMPFVVRDLARETGRGVNVELSGEDTEIDKFLVERMMDPVLHLVRNAVGHGLESVPERLAAGKPADGRLSLSASAAGEIVTIEVADDGRGIDAGLVVARARQRGLAVPDHVDETALLELICAPGFSTRDESDRVSGRGFGMAVVRSTVHDLGGAMRMVSELGKGTTFIIDLPLTLAITDALIARVGSQTFAVPQASVREVIEIDSTTVRTIEGAEVVPYRGNALPIIRLSSLLGIAVPNALRCHAFVVGSGSAAVGILVDRVVGQREIVVRATSDPLIRVEGIAGATDLGDGNAVLILDAAAVAKSGRSHRLRPRQPAREIA